MWFLLSLIMLSVARQNRYSLYNEPYDKCMEWYCRSMDRVKCEEICDHFLNKQSGTPERLGPCSYDVGQDWRGTPGAEDLPGQPLTKRSKKECAQSCFENSDCKYFVFVKSNNNHGYTSLLHFEDLGKCWLKRNYSHKQVNGVCTSGSRCNPNSESAVGDEEEEKAKIERLKKLMIFKRGIDESAVGDEEEEKAKIERLKKLMIFKRGIEESAVAEEEEEDEEASVANSKKHRFGGNFEEMTDEMHLTMLHEISMMDHQAEASCQDHTYKFDGSGFTSCGEIVYHYSDYGCDLPYVKSTCCMTCSYNEYMDCLSNNHAFLDKDTLLEFCGGEAEASVADLDISQNMVHELDNNNDGMLNSTEAKILFTKLGLDPEFESEVFDKFDSNGDRKLNMSEVKRLMQLFDGEEATIGSVEESVGFDPVIIVDPVIKTAQVVPENQAQYRLCLKVTCPIHLDCYVRCRLPAEEVIAVGDNNEEGAVGKDAMWLEHSGFWNNKGYLELFVFMGISMAGGYVFARYYNNVRKSDYAILTAGNSIEMI